jgi:hypothetical protein
MNSTNPQTPDNEVARLREFIKSIMPTPPYGEQEPEWRYAEKLLAETAPAPEETQDGVTMSEWAGGFVKITRSSEPPHKQSLTDGRHL